MKRAMLHVALVAAALSAAGQNVQYTVLDGKTDADGFPTSAARLCIGSDESNCYEPPKEDPPFGLAAKVQDVKLPAGQTLLLFSAESSGGGSGSKTILALLRLRNGRLENLLPKVTVSNQSEYHVWNLPEVSAMPLFLTADYVWAEAETHFARHRYRITSYVYDQRLGRYLQRDQYVTQNKYAGLDDVDVIRVLEPEKATMLRRLQRR